jgi:hypothetical protein
MHEYRIVLREPHIVARSDETSTNQKYDAERLATVHS